jgi:hypothetical protein
MPQKPLDLPMEVAKAFVEDMKAYFAERNAIKHDARRRPWRIPTE